MTRSAGASHSQFSPGGPDEDNSDEDPPYKDQSIEEQLLLIELKEVQRELLHSKQDAASAHANAMATAAILQTEKESLQKELRELKAEITSLNCSLDTETKRADAAVHEQDKLQTELLRTCKHGSTRSCCSSGHAGSCSQSSHDDGIRSEHQETGECSPHASETALWQALHMARDDAAQSAARAAEASALVNASEIQLKQARDEQHSLLHDVAAAVGIVVDDEMEHVSSVSVVSRAQELVSELRCVQNELQAARKQVQEEHAISVQLREDVLREKRASEAALTAVAAKQSQLDQWTSRSLIENSCPAAVHDTALQLPESQETGRSPLHQQSSDVAAIVSQWRSVSMQHVSEAIGLAEQLTAERRALQSMRAQALMLERQVETAEDQLETERSSYADRESSLRTQLQNMEAQVAEQERLLGLKSSAVAAAEAQAESTSAELLRTGERVRVLEDMVKSTEVELQSAICQMSNMQDMVISTDAKLVEAQDAMADRNDAIPGIQRITESLRRLSGLQSQGVEACASPTAKAAIQEAEGLMKAVEEVVSQKEAAFEVQSNKYQSLQHDVVLVRNQVSKLQDDLKSQRHAATSKQVEVDQLVTQRETLGVELQKKLKDLHQVEMELQDAVRLAKERANQLHEREQDVAELRSEVDRVTADWHHISGQLGACSEEAASLRGQLHASEDSQSKLISQLKDSARELANARAQAEASAASQAAAQAEADSARATVNGLLARLEESETRFSSVQIQLEKRNQEVRELNSMLKAWEAMRLSKDAQIAALMERCKRYDEDIAEKGRSNEALRRKLMHHHGSALSRGSSVNDSTSHRLNAAKTHSVTGSVAGSLSGSEASRTRHIHLHMHGRSAGEGLGPTRSAQYQVQQTGEGPGLGTRRELLSQRRVPEGQF